MNTTYIATCRAWPQGNAGLQELATALPATILPWQDIDPAAIAKDGQTVTVLPLAAWDYSETPDAYRNWLLALQDAGARVINPPALQIWNMDKRYLCELAAKGLSITPSVALLPGEDWPEKITASGWSNPVIKPLVGQSGRGVRRLADGGMPTVADYPQGVLLQPFVPTDVGEVCLIYLVGQFSHAAHRQPAPDEWRANSAYGVQILPITPQPEWLACAENVLQHLPQAPLYARVDGLIAQDGRFMVNEVELIEPALYAQLQPGVTEALKEILASSL
ncbi:MAG: hypothetical protein Q4A28_03610 [Brachymonas sp.]|nr:hypothetical protein [Brachymonas sp.]